jgi:hypothetical protein
VATAAEPKETERRTHVSSSSYETHVSSSSYETHASSSSYDREADRCRKAHTHTHTHTCTGFYNLSHLGTSLTSLGTSLTSQGGGKKKEKTSALATAAEPKEAERLTDAVKQACSTTLRTCQKKKGKKIK